jgi:hypothetical protein
MKVTVNYQKVIFNNGDPEATLCHTNVEMEVPESEDNDEILFHVGEKLKESHPANTVFSNVFVDEIPNKAIMYLKNG